MELKFCGVAFWLIRPLLFTAISKAVAGFVDDDSDATKFSVTAEVHHGLVLAYNYSYYNFANSYKNGGAAVLILKSLSGDADLYISRRYGSHRPTFRPLDFDLCSTTCGLDVVEVDNLTLPVNIGIYGHPSYVQSEFSLGILVATSANLDSLKSALDQWGVDSGNLLMLFVEKAAESQQFEFYYENSSNDRTHKNQSIERHGKSDENSSLRYNGLLDKVLSVLKFAVEILFYMLEALLL